MWNSTFDPDVTGVGHQPLYRDTFASIYDQYAVISATAKIKILNSSTVPYMVGAVIEDDTSSSSTRDTLCEQVHGVHCFLPAQNGSLSSHTWTLNWDCRRILNIDPYTSEAYKTSVGSNPTELSTLGLWSIPQDGASTITTQWRVELIQHVLWTELTTPVQS